MCIFLSVSGSKEKHAIVQWFSRIEEIPLNQRLTLGKEDSQEIFLNENSEWDTDILITSIISKVTVCIFTFVKEWKGRESFWF